MLSNDNQRWSDLSVRFLSAVILGPIALVCLFYGGWAWFGLILGAGAGLAGEWASLASHRFNTMPGRLVSAGVVFSIAFGNGAVPIGLLLLAGFTLAARYFYGWFMAAGIPYAAVGGMALVWLRLQPGVGLWDTLFLVFVVWATDIGAYAVGRVVGGAKLAPKISPGKTRSGAIGGLAAACVFGGLLAGGGHGFAFNAIPAALLLSVAAQAGDLLESAIKRRLGVKDSGSTIPGHGGLFDRLDGFLTAAPLAAVLAFFVHGGLPLWG